MPVLHSVFYRSVRYRRRGKETEGHQFFWRRDISRKSKGNLQSCSLPKTACQTRQQSNIVRSSLNRILPLSRASIYFCLLRRYRRIGPKKRAGWRIFAIVIREEREREKVEEDLQQIDLIFRRLKLGTNGGGSKRGFFAIFLQCLLHYKDS